jgi:hypothetical protein
MLGHRFAAEAARNRTNRRTYDAAYRASRERASRCTSSNAAYRCSKAYSNRVRAWCACDWVAVRSKRSYVVIFHIGLRCTVEYGASRLARLRPGRFIVRSVAHVVRQPMLKNGHGAVLMLWYADLCVLPNRRLFVNVSSCICR